MTLITIGRLGECRVGSLRNGVSMRGFVRVATIMVSLKGSANPKILSETYRDIEGSICN